MQTFNTLDELAQEFRPGERIRFRPHQAISDTIHVATIVGYVYSLPLEAGGRDEPALLVETQHYTLGHVYPFEVIIHEKGFRP
jgi:hypothetical protein